MSNIITLPSYKPPKLHKDAMLMSYENMAKIRQVYDEVIGIHDIDHVSINIVDPSDEMLIVSYNPAISHTIIKDGSYIYNGSISPDFYKKKHIYTWDEAYDPKVKNKIKFNMQIKHGINLGCVLIRQIHGFYILYSFATKKDGQNLLGNIKENTSLYYSIGDHCLDLIKDLYAIYSNNHYLYTKSIKTTKPTEHHLKLVTSSSI